jgi:hypothetical protein
LKIAKDHLFIFLILKFFDGVNERLLGMEIFLFTLAWWFRADSLTCRFLIGHPDPSHLQLPVSPFSV